MIWCKEPPPPPIEGIKRKRGTVAKYSDLIWNYRRLYFGNGASYRGKLVLITNTKSDMRFGLVSKSVTFNDPERRNGPYFSLFHRIR